jgi:hypothetical protein
VHVWGSPSTWRRTRGGENLVGGRNPLLLAEMLLPGVDHEGLHGNSGSDCPLEQPASGAGERAHPSDAGHGLDEGLQIAGATR